MPAKSFPQPKSPIWLSFIFIIILSGLLVWTTLRLWRESPTREVAVDVPNHGWLTVRLTIEPAPPLSPGPVNLFLMGRNRRGVMADLGPSVSFDLGLLGQEESLIQGLATRNPDSPGYRTTIQFPSPGEYWLTFILEGGKEVHYQVYVEPAQ